MKIAGQYYTPQKLLGYQRDLSGILAELFAKSTAIRHPDAGHLHGARLLHDPVLIDQVFRKSEIFEKDMLTIANVSKSRLTENGENWKALRNHSQPIFNQFMRENPSERISNIVTERLAGIQTEDASSTYNLFSKITVHVFKDVLALNFDVSEMLSHFDDIRYLITLLTAFSWDPDEFDESEEETLNKFTQDVYAAFAETCASDPNIISYFSQSSLHNLPDHKGTSLTDFMQNVFAGFETTASTMSWIAVSLARNTNLQNYLHQAVKDGGGDSEVQSFINETLRYFPPIPFLGRRANQTIEVEGEAFNEGEFFLISILGLQRHPDYWENPNDFEGQRKEFIENKFDKRAFQPFISGARVCGGRRIAELELLIAVKQLVLGFEFTTASEKIGLDYALAMRPILPSDFKMTRRSNV